MKKIVITILLINVLLSASANKINLSNSATVSLLTCSPGKQLYSVFGHTAFKITDSQYKIDKVYNYGTFSFNTPNFYIKFGRGFLNYYVSVVSSSLFLNAYKHQNRMVKEQILNLNQQQKQAMFDFLENNIQEENKYYLYDFFFNNCATKPRDVLSDVFQNKVQFNDSLQNLTFRDLIHPYLMVQPWTHFGLNILLGIPTDRVATTYEYMFLPDFLFCAYANAKIEKDGNIVSLISKSETVVRAVPQSSEENIFSSPIFIMWGLLVLTLILTFIGYKWNKKLKLFDFSIFFIIGLLGVLIFLMWFFSAHYPTRNNWNIIWAFPLHFAMAFLLFKSKRPNWVRYYFLIFGILAFLFIIFLIVIPQGIPYPAIPLILIIAVRSVNVFRYNI